VPTLSFQDPVTGDITKVELTDEEYAAVKAGHSLPGRFVPDTLLDFGIDEHGRLYEHEDWRGGPPASADS
jgi:hypothetical protein